MFVTVAIHLHILLRDAVAAASDESPVMGGLQQEEEQGENDPSLGTTPPASFLASFRRPLDPFTPASLRHVR